MISLLYVSESRISGQRLEAEVRAIVGHAAARNAEIGVTGALFSTRRYFAQILEGPAGAVHALMDVIQRDARHGNVTVVSARDIEARAFVQWSMIRISATIYVERRIEALLANQSRGGEIELRHMMVALAPAGPQGESRVEAEPACSASPDRF